MTIQDGNGEITHPFDNINPGTEIHQYEIRELIGAGGMGVVYQARDKKLDRMVALKFLARQLCLDADCRRRFKGEAQAAAQLNHPNIIVIHEVNEYEGRPYFAMNSSTEPPCRNISPSGGCPSRKSSKSPSRSATV